MDQTQSIEHNKWRIRIKKNRSKYEERKSQTLDLLDIDSSMIEYVGWLQDPRIKKGNTCKQYKMIILGDGAGWNGTNLATKEDRCWE